MKGHIESLLTDDDLDVLTVEIKLCNHQYARSDLERKNKIILTPCRCRIYCQRLSNHSKVIRNESLHFNSFRHMIAFQALTSDDFSTILQLHLICNRMDHNHPYTQFDHLARCKVFLVLLHKPDYICHP